MMRKVERLVERLVEWLIAKIFSVFGMFFYK